MQGGGGLCIRSAVLKKHKTSMCAQKVASNATRFLIVCPSGSLWVLHRCFEEQASCRLKPQEYLRETMGSLNCCQLRGEYA